MDEKDEYIRDSKGNILEMKIDGETYLKFNYHYNKNGDAVLQVEEKYGIMAINVGLFMKENRFANVYKTQFKRYDINNYRNLYRY